MPENTRVHRCVDDVKQQGHDEGSAIAICQKSTGQSFATGKSTRKSDHNKVGSPKSESTMLPSLRVMGIAAADPALFESLMAQAGFRIVPRDDDPLNTHVQEEAVAAVASAITEDTYHGVRLGTYHRKLKTLAEQAGYVVMIENCGPPGADPCGELDGEEMVPLGEVGEGEALLAAGDSGIKDEMVPPPDDDGNREVEQIASLPIGTELAAQILAVINGEGTDALMEPDDEFGPDEFGPEPGPVDAGLPAEEVAPAGPEANLPPAGPEEEVVDDDETAY